MAILSWPCFKTDVAVGHNKAVRACLRKPRFARPQTGQIFSSISSFFYCEALLDIYGRVFHRALYSVISVWPAHGILEHPSTVVAALLGTCAQASSHISISTLLAIAEAAAIPQEGGDDALHAAYDTSPIICVVSGWDWRFPIHSVVRWNRSFQGTSTLSGKVEPELSRNQHSQ
ncbi:hypothetical protein OBBRIDRAFT_872977 [Obba rivulosa]|uniref:Uncharacterized protein n=1 Tax=Obba rivulosa TaxID=1052685 RepID=A0A8E2AYE8_9APHY|nr:hypothetical protein OBBRIDRAFT_872977 [Obba rivulosa]